MNLLMITRKVDLKDASPAGFTYDWVKKLGEKLEKLHVITWQESHRGDLPGNIEIVSLFGSKFKKIFILQKELFRVLPKVDGVFCHQNPEYTILITLGAKVFSKKIVSWYTHKAVNWKLHLVNCLADKILTASEESCRLKNRKKIEIVGHGIDVEKFKVQKGQTIPSLTKFKLKDKFKILSVGRISPVKDYQTLIGAIARTVLALQGLSLQLQVQIIGGPGLKEQEKYFEQLKQLVKKKNLEDYIKFLGPVSHNQILAYYQNCDLFVNLSQTGSLDKAVLEAMSYQKLVLTCNEAFFNLLHDQRLIFQKKNASDLAEKISKIIFLAKEEREKIGKKLREEVVKNHNLDKLIQKIIEQFL